MQPPRNPLLDPAQNDDIDEDGELDVEWYPLPDYLAEIDEDEDEEGLTQPADNDEDIDKGVE